MSLPGDPHQQVLELLKEAEKIASGYSGGSSLYFTSAEPLTKAIHIGLLKLSFRDTSDVPAMKKWFAPGGDFESIVGPEGANVGLQLHDLLPQITITYIPDTPPPLKRATLWNWLSMMVKAFFEAF